MVFDVVVHVPVQKTDEWIRDESPGAKPVVRHIVLKPGVLSVVAQILKPASVERSERNQDRHQPQPEVERDDDDQNVTRQRQASPVEQVAPGRYSRFWKEDFFPATFHLAETELNDYFQPVDQVPRVHDGAAQE